MNLLFFSNKIKSLLALLIVLCLTSHVNSADLIIFSYDRPMQLYALLESVYRHLSGVDSISVIYRVSNDKFFNSYKKVQKRFPDVLFAHQEETYDFKPLVLEALEKTKSDYVFFSPDDVIVKNKTDIRRCCLALEQHNAYAFYLRLGTHLNFCYTQQRVQPIPDYVVIDDMVKWNLREADHDLDWGYPHSIDMTIYRKKDILESFDEMDYSSPNWLEGYWAFVPIPEKYSLGLCFKDSTMVNIPANIVQDVGKNQRMNIWTTEQLRLFFDLGLKINIDLLYGIANGSCHIEYMYNFIAQL